MARPKKRKMRKMMRRTMRQLGSFAADALAEFAGNALYHGMKRFSRQKRNGEHHPGKSSESDQRAS